MSDEIVSKTRRKRDMHALQDVGEQLVQLSADQLAQISLPEALLEAVQDARRITQFEARRRQMQYIGKLMRKIDVAPIQQKLDIWHGKSRSHTALMHQVERWRDRLLTDEAALGELAGTFPEADLQRLRALVRNSHKEHAEGKPPRSARALFQQLRQMIVAPAAPEQEAPQP
jgi:ribosome-associated protein